MIYTRLMRWATLAIVIALSLLSTQKVQATTPASWKDTGFSINAESMNLHDVLDQFGSAYGVRVSYGLRENILLRGRMKADNGSDFLNRLANSHEFRWFVYNDTLFVVPMSDNISVRLQVGEDAVPDAKSALVGLGLFDSRFGWGELPDDGVVMLNGPREYVQFAREILLPEESPDEVATETKKIATKSRQLMVFRLKYANATDRVITTRGQKETVPGIKTILTNLMNSEFSDKASANSSNNNAEKFDIGSEKRSRLVKNGPGTAQEIGQTDASIERRQREHNREDSSSKSKNIAQDDRPHIDADPSRNAIIIFDSGSKREMYQQLITELDVEPQQVEIEALIIDIDRNKLAEMGVSWGSTTNGNYSGAGLPQPGSSLLITNSSRFYADIKAMEGAGDLHVLARPTVLTLDNVAAVLDLSQTAYVPLVGERVANLADVTAGTMLRVVPRIIHDGNNTKVRLDVDIEDGGINDPSLKSAVTRSTINTQAFVDLQQTLMIGGYHSETTSLNKDKIPGLGDAPIVGGLFRSTSESHSERERLFLITPRISGTAGTPALERSKASTLSMSGINPDVPKVPDAPKVKNAQQLSPPVVTVSATAHNSNNYDKTREAWWQTPPSAATLANKSNNSAPSQVVSNRSYDKANVSDAKSNEVTVSNPAYEKSKWAVQKPSELPVLNESYDKEEMRHMSHGQVEVAVSNASQVQAKQFDRSAEIVAKTNNPVPVVAQQSDDESLKLRLVDSMQVSASRQPEVKASNVEHVAHPNSTPHKQARDNPQYNIF